MDFSSPSGISRLILLCFFVLVVSGERQQRSLGFYKTGKELASQVKFLCTSHMPKRDTRSDALSQMSGTLDHLLDPKRYNKRVRPGFGKAPVHVEINLSINGMGPVDENTMVGTYKDYLMCTYLLHNIWLC